MSVEQFLKKKGTICSQLKFGLPELFGEGIVNYKYSLNHKSYFLKKEDLANKN